MVVFGSWRLSQWPLPGKARVASLHTYDRAGLSRSWQLYVTNKAAFRTESEGQLQQLMANTRTQARAGTQLVMWSESSPMLLTADEARVLTLLRKLAHDERIYLVACPYLYSHPMSRDQNKLWLIDPAGQLLATHYKYGGNLLEGCVKGDEKLRAANTPLGKLTGIICWDGDFPQTVRQTSALKTGLLLIPAADWDAISPLHTVVAQFRGIENGCSVVRQTLSGRSVMADPYGRVISQMNHFTTANWLMQGQLPTQHVPTIYGYLGDWFAWLCLAGLAAFGWQWVRSRR